MVTKKTTKTTGKSNFEKKFDDVKHATTKTAKQVEKEFKAKTSGLSSWWSRASDEEKVYTLLGLVALVWGLYLLIDILIGMVLIVIGILFITGFFVKKHN